jgi:predicted nuclease of predicted toxin-antitoxin system
MRLYVDDHLTDRRVVAQLQRTGHTVVLPAEVGHTGASDAQYFAQAIRHAAALLTRNYKDFIELHDLIRTAGGNHPGLLLVYLENDPTRDMTPRSIAEAVSRLETAAVPLVNHVYVLNHWR